MPVSSPSPSHRCSLPPKPTTSSPCSTHFTPDPDNPISLSFTIKIIMKPTIKSIIPQSCNLLLYGIWRRNGRSDCGYGRADLYTIRILYLLHTLHASTYRSLIGKIIQVQRLIINLPFCANILHLLQDSTSLSNFTYKFKS